MLQTKRPLIRYDLSVLTRQMIDEKRQAILDIARAYGATDVRIFGSVARGDDTPESDLDLIVRFEPRRSLFDHGGLVMDLMELLGRRVDVIDEDGMRPRFRQHVMKEVVPLVPALKPQIEAILVTLPASPI